MKTKFANLVIDSSRRTAFTIGVSIGLNITGDSVLKSVTDATSQANAVWALHEYLGSSVIAHFHLMKMKFQPSLAGEYTNVL